MQRKYRLAILFSVALLVSLGCELVTPVPNTPGTPSALVIPSSVPPANLLDPAVKNSSQALDNVARMIYDAQAAGQNLNSYVAGVMTAFEVPPLDENDLDLAKERYSQGLPLMFLPQVPEMAGAFHDGVFVSLDSFIAAANEQGATQQGTNEPLTREYLTQKFMAYTDKSQYEPEQVLPAFVLALARARAAHFPSNDPDPLWGDGLLDPLQLTLLLYSVSYSGAGNISSEVPTTAIIIPQVQEISFTKGLSPAVMVEEEDPIGEYIHGKIRGKITSEVQSIVEVPLDKKAAAQVSVCASLLLYGHKMQVTNTPKLIYHKDGEKPSTTTVKVSLTFQDDYWDNYLPIDRWMIETFTNCELPHRGPAADKPLEWSVSEGLIGHGDFDLPYSKTDQNGNALASWKTVPETTPKSQRTFYNQRDAVGAIIVRAGSLVPGWSTLEYIVNHLRDTGGVGNAPLTVIYYVSPAYKVTGQYDQFTFSGVICNLEKPFTFKANGPMWESNFELTPTDSQSGTFIVTGALTMGGVTSTSEGTYTISPVNDGTYRLTLESPSGTFTTEQGHTGGMPGGSATLTLTPLDAQDCGGQ